MSNPDHRSSPVPRDDKFADQNLESTEFAATPLEILAAARQEPEPGKTRIELDMPLDLVELNYVGPESNYKDSLGLAGEHHITIARSSQGQLVITKCRDKAGNSIILIDIQEDKQSLSIRTVSGCSSEFFKDLISNIRDTYLEKGAQACLDLCSNLLEIEMLSSSPKIVPPEYFPPEFRRVYRIRVKPENWAEISSSDRNRAERENSLSILEDNAWLMRKFCFIPLDYTVLDAVIGLNALGFPTTYSGGGHDPIIHPYGNICPHVNIRHGDSSSLDENGVFIGQKARLNELYEANGLGSYDSLQEKLRYVVGDARIKSVLDLIANLINQAFEECRENGFVSAEGKRICEDADETGEVLNKLLDEFYKDRECAPEHKVQVGIRHPSVLLHNRPTESSGFYSNLPLEERIRLHKELLLKQREMEDFGKFLRNKFLDSGRVTAPYKVS